MKEIFRKIPGFEGYYSASSMGRIRRDCQSSNTFEGRILKSFKNYAGYHYVTLCVDGIKYVKTIHNLVAISFNGVVNKGYQVNHIDGNKSNNASNNLEIVTALQNHRHACRNNLKAKGEIQGLSKLTEDEVKQIRKLHKIFKMKREELAHLYGVHHSNITYIIQRKTWKHI